MVKKVYILIFMLGMSEMYGAQPAIMDDSDFVDPGFSDRFMDDDEFSLLLLMEGIAQSAVPTFDIEARIQGADTQLIYLHDLPSQRLRDVWDTYEILALVEESLREVALRTYKAVSVARFSLSPEAIDKCTYYLKEYYPSVIRIAWCRDKKYKFFKNFLKERATDLNLLANQVGMFSDILTEVGDGKHPIQDDLIEFKRAILFVSHCMHDLLLKQWPEVAAYSGIASEIEDKVKKCIFPSARDKWKLAGVLHEFVNCICGVTSSYVNAVGEELMLSICLPQYIAESTIGVNGMVEDVTNKLGQIGLSKPPSILRPHAGGVKQTVAPAPKGSYFGFKHRPKVKEKEVKFKLSKNKKYKYKMRTRSKSRKLSAKSCVNQKIRCCCKMITGRKNACDSENETVSCNLCHAGLRASLVQS